ncbi:hypothetical protein FB451DRAFT_1412619 [Mycena latifolia]|nr:hypothetical protein FB451DRAFT_1412619 [Mycena latifolia]
MRTLFRNGVAACDGVRADDEKQEIGNNEHFDVTEWIVCGEDAADENIVLLVRLHPTYELPPSDNKKDSPHAPRTPRKRISKIDPTAKSNPQADEMTDVDKVVPEIAERNVGDKYPPSVLSDYRGPFFAHEKAQLTQRDYRDADGKLIAPSELYHKLIEGTLVIDQKTERGAPIPDKKIYHVFVDRLRILDRGDGEVWDPVVPTIPEHQFYSPMNSPQKRGRDDAADTAFNNFGFKSSPSPTTRAKRNAGAH